MEIRLYINHSEKERVNKILTNELILNGDLTNDCPILTPTFQLEIENMTMYNYMYVPDFNRYYFIENPVNMGGNYYSVPCTEDYISSWWNDIKECNAVIERQSNEWNLYLNDGTFKAESTNKTATILFPNDLFTQENYILCVAGAPVTEGE